MLAPARDVLGDIPSVELHPPLDYPELVRRLMRARLVLTDRSGIQEEAPTFGTPVLVLREKTERPEGIAAGVNRERIVAAAIEILAQPVVRPGTAVAVNPYGDGRAAERIVAVLAGEPIEPLHASTLERRTGSTSVPG